MKKIFALLIFITISTICFAQNNDTSKFWDHVRYGGGFGIEFGSNNTAIGISPSAIYEFNEAFALGVGTSYLYAKNNHLKSNVFGASIISLYNPLREIQLSAEFEQLFVNQKLNALKSNFDYPALYIGGAYRTGAFSIGVRYDVLYKENKSIFSSAFSPIVRFYF